MALWGSRKKFDKNSDGQLSHQEWWHWYQSTSGPEIEQAERRQAAQVGENQSSWLHEVVRITHTAAGNYLSAACELLSSMPPKDAKELAWKALLCQLTVALSESGLWSNQEKTNAGLFVNGQSFYPYRAAAADLARMSGLCGEAELARACLNRQPLFQEEGSLTPDGFGTFWEQIITQLPPYYDETQPAFENGDLVICLPLCVSGDTEEAIRALFESLFPVVSFFAGATEEAADRRNNRLLGFFTAHWKKLRGEYADPLSFHDCNSLNFARRYPQLRERWTREELENMDSVTMLSELYRADPEQAITIWRSIAGTDQPLIDPRTAEDFLRELEPVWYDGDLRPILELLKKDETFAKQIFQSAYVDSMLEDILRAAYTCESPALAEHLFELLKENPLPRRKWTESYEEFEEMMEELSESEEISEPTPPPRGKTSEIPDDGTIYSYCQVQFPGMKRTYAYLTNGLDLKVGDQVYAPLGHTDTPTLGTVTAVENHSRSAAPYPPEKAKKVLRIQKLSPDI